MVKCCAICHLLGQFGFQKHLDVFTVMHTHTQTQLFYCNAVTPITDLVCALFGPHAAMFVNRIYPGMSLKTSFVSPGKPRNWVFASPVKSWQTVFYCLYKP